MTDSKHLISQLFRTEYRKITSVLCRVFGIQQLEWAEDIVSETFLVAAETWRLKGVPEQPAAWLYSVAKNKAKDRLKREQLYRDKIAPQVSLNTTSTENPIDALTFLPEQLQDSQLRMLFSICHPSIPEEAQMGLALRILCGLGIEEIASAFLSNKELINKRLYRARQKLREAKVDMSLPDPEVLPKRLETVLRIIYLLFSEGYYSNSQPYHLQQHLCLEAMRLNLLLVQGDETIRPEVYANLAMMCFHSSRFEARVDEQKQWVLYEDQDRSRWDQQLIEQGHYYLRLAAEGDQLTKYHLEARIAYWHTQDDQHPDKWQEVLQLYNWLLQVEYSPIAALNRTYALARVEGAQTAIKEALKLNLEKYHLYYALLGELHLELDRAKSVQFYERALTLTQTPADRHLLEQKLAKIR